MRNKLDRILSIAFKPLFFAWLVALILFVLFRNYSDSIYWLFVTLTVIVAALIGYAVYSLVSAVRDALKDGEE